MENLGLYEDIAKRTDGDIYVGVVGPVRTGKSTFIKNFMDLLVIPNIDNEYKKERAQDELPQSAAGKTIMTTEPKFVPNEAIDITIDDKLKLKTRLVDCVGYLIPNSIGATEDNQPRMVKTPWSDEEMPFEQAAEIGTKKVIEEHSTIGILITTDGSITEIPRGDYVKAEERVVYELKAINKPFVILLNSEHPNDPSTINLANELSQKYNSTTIPINCANLNLNDITNIFSNILYEFPVSQINFKFPAWVNGLDLDHDLKIKLFTEIRDSFEDIKLLREISPCVKNISKTDIISNANTDNIMLGTGNVNISICGIEGESLLLMLDNYGIMASSGSACTSGSLDPSHVLLALGLSHEVAHSSLRLSFGEEFTEEDADYILAVLPEITERLRNMSPMWETMQKEHIHLNQDKTKLFKEEK